MSSIDSLSFIEVVMFYIVELTVSLLTLEYNACINDAMRWLLIYLLLI